MMLDVLSDTIMEFPTTSEEAEKAKREDVMLFRAQKFAPHEADFERIKNVFLSILKDIKKDMDEKEPTSPPVQMEFLKKLMGAFGNCLSLKIRRRRRKRWIGRFLSLPNRLR